MGNLADMLVIIGLGMLGYGLYLFEPWVCYSVIGFIIMSAGAAIGNNIERDRHVKIAPPNPE